MTPGTVPEARDARSAPLSSQQRRLWLLDRMGPDRPTYNVPYATRLRGFLDTGALERALQRAVDRHEALRTTFPDRDGLPEQRIHAHLPVPLDVIDLTHLPAGARRREVERRVGAEAARPFDLEKGPLLRASLLRGADDDHTLLLTVHQIIFDAASRAVLARELAEGYAGFTRGEAPADSGTPLGYADAIRMQEELARGAAEKRRASLAWWRDRLSGAPALLALPTDRPRPAVQSHRGSTVPFRVEPPLFSALSELASGERISLLVVLEAALAALLARWSGQEDVAIGIPVPGRHVPAAEPVIGLFGGTLVLRNDLSGDPTFRELLARVRETAFAAYEHREVPLEALVEELSPERTLSHAPLFQVMLALRNAGDLAFGLPGLRAEPIHPDTGTSRFDLTFSFDEGASVLAGRLEYATDLFERATAGRLATQLLRVLARMARDPDERVSRAPLLSEKERHRTLVEWNRTDELVPCESVPGLVDRALAARRDAPAVACGGTRLSAEEVRRISARVARRLRASGAGRDAPIAVALPRSAETVAALLGVLRSGAAYLPLDPSYPEERLRFMLEDSEAPLLLTSRALAGRLPRGKTRVLFLEEITDAPDEALPDPSAEDLAYVIYTSGSTGRPKGVECTHGSLSNVIAHFLRVLAPREDDVLLSVTTLSFDIASLEIWLPLAAGARLVVATREEAKDAAALAALLESSGATLFQATPTTYRLLLEAGWRGSPAITLICGGEILPRDLADALLPRCRALTNAYGPTETTIWSALDRVAPSLPYVPIGRPIANTRLYIVDPHGEPVPVGVLGEILIGGAGLARGYRGRPDLTAERFLPDPFSGASGARVYRTGDLARYLPDGRIDVVGRIDQQVKLRGFRIEPGEVEAALASHPDVASCAVALKGAGEQRRVVAYVVPAAGSSPRHTALREHLARLLPDFMLPSATVLLGVLPTTPSGKTDRGALPEPDLSRAESSGRAPADAAEERVLAIFRAVLGSPGLSPEDDFFAAGGHSLLAARLFALLEKEFARKLPLAAIFSAPTPAALASLLRRPADGREEWSLLVPIQPNGSRAPLFCVHAIGGNVLTYADLARRLGPDQPVFGLQARGLSGREAPHATVEEMAAAYVKEIRALRPKGPYHLAGSSFGGTVAFEIARQMRASGAEVGVLALFDTWGPDYGKRIPGMTPLRLSITALRERFDLHAGNLMVAEGVNGIVRYVLTKSRRVLEDLRKNARRLRRRAERILHPLPKELRHVEAKGRSALSAYVPRVYDGRVTLFRASRQPVGIVPDPTLGWSRVAAGGIEVHEIPGYHGAIVYEPRAGELARKLAACLAAHVSPEPKRPAARPGIHIPITPRAESDSAFNEAAR